MQSKFIYRYKKGVRKICFSSRTLRDISCDKYLYEYVIKTKCEFKTKPGEREEIYIIYASDANEFNCDIFENRKFLCIC